MADKSKDYWVTDLDAGIESLRQNIISGEQTFEKHRRDWYFFIAVLALVFVPFIRTFGLIPAIIIGAAIQIAQSVLLELLKPAIKKRKSLCSF